MTATESSKKKSFFGTRLKNNFTAHKKLLIVNIVMSVLGLPVLAVIAIIIAYFDNIPYEEMTEQMSILEDQVTLGCIPFMMLSVVTIGISIFLGMIIALMHFSYLYRKTVTDMNYALPLTGTQRFFADYLSGLIIYMAPIIGAVIFFFTAMGIATLFLERGLSGYWDAFPGLLKMAGIALTAILLFYTLSVLAITFCGNTFEAIFSIIAFNSLIPSTVGCVWLAICTSTSYGIVSEAILYKNILTSTSPIGSLFFVFQFIDTVDSSSSSSYQNSFLFKWLFVTLLVIAIYLVGAYFIYRFRKSEDVSKPYVHKAAFYAIMTMAVYCVLSIFISLGAFLVAGIVICAVGWFIMEVITRRGFKKFWQAGVGFVLCVISVIAVCKICEATDGFGMARSVPSSLTVESVIIDDVTYKNKDVIKKTIELHHELVDRHFHSDNYEYTPAEAGDGIIAYDDYLEITYKTVTGSTIMREYRVPTGMESELTKAIVLSDEYANAASTSLYDSWFRYYPENEIRKSVEIYDKYGYEEILTITREEGLKLSQAYRDDLKAMTVDDLEKFDELFYIRSYGNECFILSSFTNTLSFLRDKHITPEKISPERLYNWDVEGMLDPVFITRSKKLFENDDRRYSYEYYNAGSYDKYFVADSICTINSGISDSYSKNRYFRHCDELTEVLEKCTPNVIEGKPIAVFFIRDDYNYRSATLYLRDTPENRQLIEKLDKAETFMTGGGFDDDSNDYSEYGWD